MRWLEEARRNWRVLVPITCLLVPIPALAQSTSFGLGKTPSAAEIRAKDIAIGPTGKELPQGSGTAKVGARIFAQKCAKCHGAAGAGGASSILIGAHKAGSTKGGFKGTQMEMGFMGGMARVQEIMARDAPYATVVWDKINRAMPLDIKGLKPDEVYSLTAFLLAKNGVIKEDEVMNAQTLPKVKMPMPKYAAPDWKPGQKRLANYP